MPKIISQLKSRKVYIIQVIVIFTAIFIASYVEKNLGQPVIGGFLFGFIFSVGMIFVDNKKGERFSSTNIGMTIILSCIMAGLYYLFSL